MSSGNAATKQLRLKWPLGLSINAIFLLSAIKMLTPVLAVSSVSPSQPGSRWINGSVLPTFSRGKRSSVPARIQNFNESDF